MRYQPPTDGQHLALSVLVEAQDQHGIGRRDVLVRCYRYAQRRVENLLELFTRSVQSGSTAHGERKCVTPPCPRAILCMMSFLAARWRQISMGLLLAFAVGGAVGLDRMVRGDCCSEGAACCKPGAACCKGAHKLAQN